jgi:hypothetical protein
MIAAWSPRAGLGHTIGRTAVISDRLIEEGSLAVADGRACVEVRIPWYRAVPASCIADVVFAVDGRTPPADSLRVELNGTVRTLSEFPALTDEQWFPTDALTVSGDLEVRPETEHLVSVQLKLFIPYIVTAHGVLMIDERHELRMTARSAPETAVVR